MGYETVQTSYDNADIFQTHRLNELTWLVTRKSIHTSAIKSVIPSFRRVRTVELSSDRMHCNCPHEKVYGLPCCHVIAVCKNIPGWKFPTHHDVSVIWWKSYYYYGLPISQMCPNRDTIYKFFHTLRKIEKLGVHIDIDQLKHLSIDGYPVPLDFQMDVKNPVACNYPTFDYNKMISTTNLNCTAEIPGMSQSLLQNQDDNFAELDRFFNDNNEQSLTPIFGETVSPYNRLKASFKALTALMEGNCDEKEIKAIELFFDDQQGYFTKKVCEGANAVDTSKNLNFVSSNTQSSKKRKHHGARGY